MKIKILVVLAVVTCLIPFYHQNKVQAAGSGGLFATITPSSSTPTVGQTITLALHVFDVFCQAPQNENSYYSETPSCNPGYTYTEEHPNWSMGIAVSGSGNNLSSSKFTPDHAGNAQVSLSSSVAEAKSVTVTNNGGVLGTKSITYTVPASSNPTTTKKAASPTPTPPPPVVNLPATLTPESIQIDGKAVTADQKVTVQSDKAMELSGKTVPNGVVSLYVFSEPKKYTVTADKDGNWTYAVKGLEPGEHHIEAEVTDPATNKTSTRGTILSFAVQAAPVIKTAVTPQKINKSSDTKPLIAVATLLALLALIAGYLWFFKRDLLNKLFKKKNSTPPVAPPIDPPAQTKI
jgi:hypothetical protein